MTLLLLQCQRQVRNLLPFTWAAGGHEFLAQHRLLRYLGEPLVEQALTSADRRALERFCTRMPEIIPAMPPVPTHGDLWPGNLLGKAGGLAAIDPAVSCTWAEVDLSMLWSAAATLVHHANDNYTGRAARLITAGRRDRPG